MRFVQILTPFNLLIIFLNIITFKKKEYKTHVIIFIRGKSANKHLEINKKINRQSIGKLSTFLFYFGSVTLVWD